MSLDGYSFITIPQFVAQELRVSAWITIDQEWINPFAQCTDDHQWIHKTRSRLKGKTSQP